MLGKEQRNNATESLNKMPPRLRILPRDLTICWYPGNCGKKLARNTSNGKLVGCMVNFSTREILVRFSKGRCYIGIHRI